jgi:manganese/iron transport system permease protein
VTLEFFSVFGLIVVAAILGGGSAGLLGVFVIALRIPFIAVFSAHSALAGAVFGLMAGIPPAFGGFAGALTGAVLLGLLTRNRHIDPNAALGTLFSLMLGIAFLGIGLTGGPKSEVLGLMWGSLLFVTPQQITVIAALTIILAAFIYILEKELKLLLFSRELAALMIPEWMIFTGLLVLAAGIISINLQIVGGLLLYSLIANPAVMAFRLARSFRGTILISAAMGALSAVGGFLAAYFLNLPAGACIVLFSSLLLGIVFLVHR